MCYGCEIKSTLGDAAVDEYLAIRDAASAALAALRGVQHQMLALERTMTDRAQRKAWHATRGRLSSATKMAEAALAQVRQDGSPAHNSASPRHEDAMKLQIQRTARITETIDVALPHYYKDAALDDAGSAIYGKVDATRHTSIEVSFDRWSRTETFRLEIEHCEAATLGDYMTEKYRSDEAEYLAAKERLLAAARDA